MKTATRALPSYLCIRCEETHTKPAETPYEAKPGESWGDLPQEVRDNRHERATYDEHRKYADNSEAGEALKRLRGWLRPGSVLQITIPQVSRSGMSRQMRVYSRSDDGGMLCLTWNVATALGYPMVGREALRIGGCGMDMTFALADELAHALWPKGYACPGKRHGCPHPDEWKRDGDHRPIDGTKHHARRHKADGNYTFKREVL